MKYFLRMPVEYQSIGKINYRFLAIDELWKMFPQFRKFRSLYCRPESFHRFMKKFCLRVLSDGCIRVKYMGEKFVGYNTFENNMFVLFSTSSSKVIGLFFFGTIPYAMRLFKPVLFDPQKNIMLCSHEFDVASPMGNYARRVSHRGIKALQYFADTFNALIASQRFIDIVNDNKNKRLSGHKSNLVLQTGAGHLYHDLINVASLSHDVFLEAPKSAFHRLRRFSENSESSVWPINKIFNVPEVTRDQLNDSIYLRAFGSQPSLHLFEKIRNESLNTFMNLTPNEERKKLFRFNDLFPVVTFSLRPEDASPRGSRGFIEQHKTLSLIINYLGSKYPNYGIMLDGYNNNDWKNYNYDYSGNVASAVEKAIELFDASNVNYINLVGRPCYFNVIADYFSDLFICPSGSGLCRPYYVSGLNGIIHSSRRVQEDNPFRSWNYSSRSQFYARSTIHNHVYHSETYYLDENRLYTDLEDLISKSGRVYGPELF